MSYEKHDVLVPQKVGEYPSLNRLAAIIQNSSPNITLEQLVKKHGELDSLCDATINRHETLLAHIRKSGDPATKKLSSDSIAEASVPVVAASTGRVLEACERKAEVAEAQINALQKAMMNLEASVFDYKPETIHQAVEQMRFLCGAADCFGVEEMGRFVAAMKNATDVVWNNMPSVA